MRNSLKLFVLMAVAALVAPSIASAGSVNNASSGGWASASGNGTAAKARKAKRDPGSNTLLSSTALGWKDFQVASGAATLLVDETSGTVKQGIVHQVCTSQGIAPSAGNLGDAVLLFDSTTTTPSPAFTAQTLPRFMPAIRAATTITCTTYDVQFDNGLVVYDINQSTGETHVFYQRGDKEDN